MLASAAGRGRRLAGGGLRGGGWAARGRGGASVRGGRRRGGRTWAARPPARPARRRSDLGQALRRPEGRQARDREAGAVALPATTTICSGRSRGLGMRQSLAGSSRHSSTVRVDDDRPGQLPLLAALTSGRALSISSAPGTYRLDRLVRGSAGVARLGPVPGGRPRPDSSRSETRADHPPRPPVRPPDEQPSLRTLSGDARYGASPRGPPTRATRHRRPAPWQGGPAWLPSPVARRARRRRPSPVAADADATAGAGARATARPAPWRESIVRSARDGGAGRGRTTSGPAGARAGRRGWGVPGWWRSTGRAARARASFAARLADALAAPARRPPDRPVVHTDDLLDGWDNQLTFWPRLEE